MINRLFSQIINSFGIVIRTFRAFFMRQIVGISTRFKRLTSMSRHAAKAVPKTLSAVALARQKPTKRADYVETSRLFIAKSTLIFLVIAVIVLAVLGYYLAWPWLQSKFFTTRLYRDDANAAQYTGRVVLYYDQAKNQPYFQGKLVEGVAQGSGKAFDENGLTVYAGNYLDGLYQGKGQLYKNGALVYDGYFADGAYHGAGSLYDENGLLYRGEFSGGEYSGSGVLYANGEAAYEGMFARGRFNGQGTLYEAGGVVYTGDFVAGLKQGQGMEYLDGNIRYKGGFANDLYDGEGFLYGKGGALVYKGGFAEGLRSGQGIAYYDSGVIQYNGGFAGGLYEGDGTLYQEDGRSMIKAEFAAGNPTGDIRIYDDGRLYYEGASQGLIPHGYGTLYAKSTGEAIYRGPIRYGSIDGASLLGITLDEAQAVFADAVLSESRSSANGFSVVNPKLGVTLVFSLKSAAKDPAVIYVYQYATGEEEFFAHLPWQTTAEYEAWRLEYGQIAADKIAAEHLSANFAGEVPFPRQRYYKTTYQYEDMLFAAWSARQDGELFMLEWRARDGSLSVDSAGSTSASLSLSGRTESLLAKLGLLPSVASGGSKTAANAYYGTGDMAELLSSAAISVADIYVLFGSVIDYLENAEKREACEEQLALRKKQLETARESVLMGGDEKLVSALENEISRLDLQISKCIAAMEKARLIAFSKTGQELAAYDLQQALFIVDPTEFDFEELSGAVAEGTTDPLEIKLALLDLELAYQELQQTLADYNKTETTIKTMQSDYEMGKATQEQLDNTCLERLTLRVELYLRLCGYTREMLRLNQLTEQWPARQYNWYPQVFAAETEDSDG